ncbi:hypothetical protein [Gillisia sp. CAL575]|uniref:hypothetical protein n=1 Tax=Gillisia sp. CAL575 TaxID=985255 RepID=UPI0003A4FF19|nr:hypothetical protein [Gillisia sp. CAL575]
MKKILIIIIILLITSCKSQYSTAEIRNNFTPNQVKDLNKITEFFKEQICFNTESDFRKCYKRIPHDYLKANGSGFWTNINFEQQKDLYDQISKTTFNEIWMFSNATFNPSGTKAKNLSAVATGKYQNFLADFGKSNARIAKYAERIKAFGDYGGFDFDYREILKDRNSFDLKDPNIQLILAIHYLSLNDQDTRNKALMRTKKTQFK